MTSINAIFEECQSRGERLTIQRRLVIEALYTNQCHTTINDIQKHITTHHQGQNLPEPTIYRILQWLKDLQLVSQTDIGNRGVVYEIIGGEPHHHLICLNCGGIINVDDSLFAGLRQQLNDQYQFAPRIEHMAIYGHCPICADDQKKL
jgi:Fur family transcriptional regulator, ferric uptake regulator